MFGWILLFRAVLVLALGISLLASGTQRSLIGNLIATYWLVGALVTLRWAFTNRGHGRVGLPTAAGIIGVIAAVIVLARSQIQEYISLDTALALLGITAVATGVLRMLGTFRDDQVAHHTRAPRRFVLGAIEVTVGLMFIAFSDVTRPLTISVGVWALVGGTIMLLDALSWRRSVRSTGEASRDQRDPAG
jgi:uncharacterized membrane protein HdeD (DUF308 family)